MKYIESGEYVGWKGMNLILSDYGYIGDEENRDKPDGFYIGIHDEKYIDEECYTEYGGTEYEYYSKPAKAEEIEYLYEISHYVCYENQKYKSFWASSSEELMELFIDERRKDEYKDYDLHEIDRGVWIIRVPKNEVTLYETKIYYDKDKYINENKRIVLSEETYLIDEPWWFEETKDN
ncbi:hypothetical protein [uncultured Eubacterium sp.]|uniref:hypothetical protein n=1 Tax=uncultured Eubacterium sp. TaxID=165185 RepID=UPI000E878C63|nr:hypothetical protein [uncultured Eubacterium sp.]HAV90896.1 hypothetical protein [Eubacterium sp.]